MSRVATHPFEAHSRVQAPSYGHSAFMAPSVASQDAARDLAWASTRTHHSLYLQRNELHWRTYFRYSYGRLGDEHIHGQYARRSPTYPALMASSHILWPPTLRGSYSYKHPALLSVRTGTNRTHRPRNHSFTVILASIMALHPGRVASYKGIVLVCKVAVSRAVTHVAKAIITEAKVRIWRTNHTRVIAHLETQYSWAQARTLPHSKGSRPTGILQGLIRRYLHAYFPSRTELPSRSVCGTNSITGLACFKDP